jgi:hypothetical protein
VEPPGLVALFTLAARLTRQQRWLRLDRRALLRQSLGAIGVSRAARGDGGGTFATGPVRSAATTVCLPRCGVALDANSFVAPASGRPGFSRATARAVQLMQDGPAAAFWQLPCDRERSLRWLARRLRSATVAQWAQPRPPCSPARPAMRSRGTRTAARATGCAWAKVVAGTATTALEHCGDIRDARRIRAVVVVVDDRRRHDGMVVFTFWK